MSPTDEDLSIARETEKRLTALETDGGHTKELLKEIKDTLRRLPHRISKNTKQQLVDCRAIQDTKNAKNAPNLSPKPTDLESAENISWSKKLGVVLIGLGLILGTAAYQYRELTAKSALIQQKGGNK